MTLCMSLAVAPTADAGPTAAQKCQALKEKAAGKHGQCHAKVNSKNVAKPTAADPLAQVKCDDKTTKTFGKAELKGGAECLTIGDEPVISAALQQCADDVSAVITNDSVPGGSRSKCDSKKIKAAGKYLSCKYKVRSKAVIKGESEDFSKCDAKLTKLIGKFNVSTAQCSRIKDQAAIETSIDNCFRAITLTGIWGPTTATATVECNVLGAVLISLPVDLTITPITSVEAGTTLDVDLDVTVTIDEATSETLVGVLDSLMIPTASTIDGATISTSASAGADAANPLDSLVVGPIPIDLADDPDMNGLAGPHVNAATTILTSYDVSLAAAALEVSVDQVEVFLTAIGLPLMLSTDPGAVAPVTDPATDLTICSFTPATVMLPVQ